VLLVYVPWNGDWPCAAYYSAVSCVAYCAIYEASPPRRNFRVAWDYCCNPAWGADFALGASVHEVARRRLGSMPSIHEPTGISLGRRPAQPIVGRPARVIRHDTV